MKQVRLLLLPLFALTAIHAQDRLKTMPGYEQHEKMSGQIASSVKLGALTVTWKDANTFEYPHDGKQWRYDVTTRQAKETGEAATERTGRGGRGGGGGPARGRQFDSAVSPDGKLKAFYKDRNLWISNADGSNDAPITIDGSEKDRI